MLILTRNRRLGIEVDSPHSATRAFWMYVCSTQTSQSLTFRSRRSCHGSYSFHSQASASNRWAYLCLKMYISFCCQTRVALRLNLVDSSNGIQHIHIHRWHNSWSKQDHPLDWCQDGSRSPILSSVLVYSCLFVCLFC